MELIILAKGLGYPANIIFLTVLLLFFLRHIFLPRLKTPKITELFYKKDSPYLYILCNAKSSIMTKTDIIETHRIYLVKIDTTTQKKIYRSKITQFSTKMLEDYAKILGITNTHTFVRTSGQGFFILNNADGEVIATRKTIIKNNPEFKKVKVEEYHFMKESGELYIHDKHGYLNQLDLNTLKLLKKGKYIAKNPESITLYKTIDDYYLTEFSTQKQDKFNDNYDIPDLFSKKKKQKIQYIRKKNEKRYFVVYSDTKPPTSTLKDDFISPKCIKNPDGSAIVINGDNPRLLVLHQPYLFCKAHEMLISYVSANSEILWTHQANDLIFNPDLNEYSIVFFEHKNEKLYLYFYKKHNSNKFSISVTEPESGKILTPPVQINC